MNCASKKYIGLKQTKGITLIELIITMAMVAILIGYGLPRLTGTSQNSRLTAAINTLSGDFSFARSEAVTRNVRIDIVSINGGGDWSGGWRVVTNAAPNTVLRTSPALAANILLAGRIDTFTYDTDGSRFLPAGIAIVAADFRTCKNGDVTAHGRELQVLNTGRIKLTPGLGCPPPY